MLSDRHLGVQQAEDRAALVEIELLVGSRHEEGSVVQAAEKPTESHFELETTAHCFAGRALLPAFGVEAVLA